MSKAIISVESLFCTFKLRIDIDRQLSSNTVEMEDFL